MPRWAALIRDIMQRADEAMYADKARQKGVKNVRR